MISKPRISPPEVRSRAQLREMQRVMASALFRPLTEAAGMQTQWTDGQSMEKVAAEFIKPNDRLTSFERLEIYNRQYWFRVLDCFYDDYPGLRAVLGERKFDRLAKAYLTRLPSASFSLRNLGGRLEKFLCDEPAWAGPRPELAVDMARFEWAQVVAFDGAAQTPLTADDLLDTDPSKLRLGLQPYLSVLELEHPVDDFALAVKQHEALRSEASNAMDGSRKAAQLNKVPLPKREKVFVVVHRCDNSLYYKRLDREAHRILTRLGAGATLQRACEEAFRDSQQTPAEIGARIEEWFQTWATLGWFCQPPPEAGKKRRAAKNNL